jgi:hypothetical protein
MQVQRSLTGAPAAGRQDRVGTSYPDSLSVGSRTGGTAAGAPPSPDRAAASARWQCGTAAARWWSSASSARRPHHQSSNGGRGQSFLHLASGGAQTWPASPRQAPSPVHEPQRIDRSPADGCGERGQKQRWPVAGAARVRERTSDGAVAVAPHMERQ